MNVIVTGYSDGRKIHAIKAIRSVSGLGLKEAKSVTDDVDMGREREVALLNVGLTAELDEMGVAYRIVPVDVPLAAFVEVLSSYPRDLPVGVLHDVLRTAVEIEKANNGSNGAA